MNLKKNNKQKDVENKKSLQQKSLVVTKRINPIVSHVHKLGRTHVSRIRYDTRIGAIREGSYGVPDKNKSLYRAVLYRKRIRYDTRIVQLC